MSRGCLRSPCRDECIGECVCEQAGQLALKQKQLPLIAVLCIGVQGKIFICIKGFAAEKSWKTTD